MEEDTALVPCASRSSGVPWRVVAACAGFFADAYDLFTIDLVVLLLKYQYGADIIGKAAKTMVVSTMLGGVVLGQLGFGFVADLMGRKWAFIVTAALTVLGALASAVVQNSGQWFALPVQLAIARFWLGIGVGGEYPLSATVTAEAINDDVERRGFLMACVISMQGFGMLLSCIVAYAALSLGFGFEATWRTLLAFGAIPSFLAFWLRLQLHESAVFSRATQSATVRATPTPGTFSTIAAYWRPLVGTSSTWLCMNIFQYSLGSFKSTILDDFLSSSSADSEIATNVLFATLTSLFAISGFMFGLFLVTRIQRFTMQLVGFIAVATTFFCVSMQSDGLNPPSARSLEVYFCLIFFFVNAGPNITTFILPAEIFPTRVRATCHGISAASGKTGALLGTLFFESFFVEFGPAATYLVCGLVSMLAAGLTYFFTPREVVKLSELDTLTESTSWHNYDAVKITCPETVAG